MQYSFYNSIFLCVFLFQNTFAQTYKNKSYSYDFEALNRNKYAVKPTIFVGIDQIFLICAKIALPLWTIISINKEFLLSKFDNNRP
jgi:hypothetical protein